MKVVIINGPNLNLLGKRESDIHGNRPFDEFLQKSRHNFTQTGIDYYQSNIEGEPIDKLQGVDFPYDGIVFDAGACTHTSVALLGHIRLLTTLVVEIHISNVYAREKPRHGGMISSACLGVTVGSGLNSYKLVIEAVVGQSISVQIHKLTS